MKHEFVQLEAEDALALARCECLTKQACLGEQFDDLEAAIANRAKRWRGYLEGTHHPQKAKAERVGFALKREGEIVAYIAGHLSERFECHAELQSIYILPDYQRQGVGGELVAVLFGWLRSHEAARVCVGVEPDNPYVAFYEKLGATRFNPYYLVWEDIKD